MDQQLQAHDALAEDLSLAPSTHIGGLISSCNFGSTEIQCLWPLKAPSFIPHAHT